MSRTTSRRWPLVLLLTLLLLTVSAVAGIYWGAILLKAQVEQALGPEAQVEVIRLHWDRVEVKGLRLRAPAGWPSAETLHADVIRIYPDLRSLWEDRQVHISAIEVEGAYLSSLRTADGRMRVIPSLLERKPAKDAVPAMPVNIGKVALKDTVLEFFDASIRTPPLKLRIEDLHATVEDLHLPSMKGQSRIELDGLIKGSPGAKKDGTLSIRGNLEVASRESHIVTRLRGVDLILLGPYLVQAAKTGVKQGSLDLDVDATVHNSQLHAPGTVTLKGLELDDSGGFMGVSRRAALGVMKDGQNEISVRFELNGNLRDPKFKLNESIAARFTAGLASSVGLSLEGLVEGAANLGQKSVEAVGGAFRKLLGNSEPKNADPKPAEAKASQ
jgi:hypothetical protein